jgi:catechol 2,3-dioxygenase-like lactoylglutathione lyase family enzyme
VGLQVDRERGDSRVDGPSGGGKLIRLSTRPQDPTMIPAVTLLTLAVADLDRAVAFYRDGLGWPTEGIIGKEFEHGAVAFFDLQGGLRLALWPRASLAHDSGLPIDGPSATEVSLAHNVRSEAEVDAVMAEARAAGARIVKPAGKTFWGGYAGYFQDPDGHLWEVVWNPAAGFATAGG